MIYSLDTVEASDTSMEAVDEGGSSFRDVEEEGAFLLQVWRAFTHQDYTACIHASITRIDMCCDWTM